MTLSIVEAIWNLPGSLLDCNLATLTRQTEPPLEIVIVNASSSHELFAEAEAVCAKYPLVRMVSAPYMAFNLSRNLNVGIRESRGEYVMLTAIDQLFSANFLSEVYRLMGPGRVVGSTRGDLPAGVDIGGADTLIERWESIVALAIPPQKFSPGTIICVSREWLHEVHGFDETRCPYNYTDSDLLTRAQMCNLATPDVGWGPAYVLHMSHPRNIPLYYTPSGMPDRNLPIVRNPNGWGQI